MRTPGGTTVTGPDAGATPASSRLNGGSGSASNDGRGTSGGAVPQISVVVACYNDSANLPVAVGSALSQSHYDLEVIICDDCSTDDTETVAARLCAADARVRYVRLAQNSGSGAGPRNAGLRQVRAPWVIFLDSDDELAPGALHRLLSTADDAGAEVAAGRISRLHVADDRWTGWCTRLFEEPRTIRSIRAEPDRLYDTAAVGKLYDVDFLRREGLEFVSGLLYEDCLWTAQVYATTRCLAVVPDLVYVWKVHETAPRRSVTNDRQNLRNVRGRLQANTAIDAWLTANAHGDLLPAKHEKFLKHDVALYLGDLISEEDDWARTVIEEFREYVAQVPLEVIAGLPALHRLGVQMVDRRDLEGVRTVYRAITRGEFATDLVEVHGRVVWSARLLAAEPTRAGDLDVSELHFERRPFLQRRLAHDLRTWSAGPDGGIQLVIRTWNPMAAIDVAAARVWLEVSPRAATGVTQRFSGTIGAIGACWFESSYVLDPRPVEPAPDDERLRLVVVVQVRELDNTGTIPAPRFALTASEPDPRPAARPGPVPGWVAPVRAMDGTLALRPAAALRGHPDGVVPEPRNWSGPAPINRVRTSADRVQDAVRKRVRRRVGRRMAVFCSDGGRSFSGNPKYLYSELVRTQWPGELIWVRGSRGRSFPDGVQTVAKGSREYYLAMGSATHWVDDTDIPAHISKPGTTTYLQARDALQEARWGGSGSTLLSSAQALDQGRWDFTLLGRGAADESRPPHLSAEGRMLAGLGTPRLDPLARHAEVGKAPADLISCGLPPDPGGLDVLLAPADESDSATAGLPWRPQVAAELISGLGRLLFPVRSKDRWRIPDELSHLLVDIGRVPDRTSAILASDVLVTSDLSRTREYLLVDRPVILMQGGAAASGPGPIKGPPGPVARSSLELTGLLCGLADWPEQYSEARRDLRTRWFPAEDGRASARVAQAVFGQWT